MNRVMVGIQGGNFDELLNQCKAEVVNILGTKKWTPISFSVEPDVEVFGGEVVSWNATFVVQPE